MVPEVKRAPPPSLARQVRSPLRWRRSRRRRTVTAVAVTVLRLVPLLSLVAILVAHETLQVHGRFSGFVHRHFGSAFATGRLLCRR